jgi:hypothetical protein
MFEGMAEAYPTGPPEKVDPWPYQKILGSAGSKCSSLFVHRASDEESFILLIPMANFINNSTAVMDVLT